MSKHTKLYEALEFATKCHEGQVRKYTGEAYIEHPVAVACMLRKYFTFSDDITEDGCIAAILHNTVEDTEATHDDIVKRYGETIASYVWFLTKPEAFVGNRKLRKALDIGRLREAPEVVKAIKLCDLMHNSLSIEEHDPKFWKTFKREAFELVIIDGGAGLSKVAATYSKMDFFLTHYSDFMDRISK